ncbi:uncharacterized protein LOC108138438 [Drosophila elegans]|uniref:uncharacterized protein LOC108138438 n=1 Tax=Drosophila elegans TaxID=30023 RepID=UPI0007E78964|nr:uncharacterized protein LOC108138438 [Drosophila elegans]XP_041566833.1 uncharacterized protein LOC108138438 [Drosophila elegans]XP_041566834.1 uncharacterized protein LOC108138438 [Drosophila elegans]XP_041566835.1 uncharacterized protein LOC108138438 [Drosophila elegans]
MSEESSQSESGSGSGSESEEGPETDVELARNRTSSTDDLKSNDWLSLHHFAPGAEEPLLSVFSRFCSVYAYRQREKGLELQFTSAEHLQSGVLMAKRLVVGRMQLRWHVGRLNQDPGSGPSQNTRSQAGELGVFGKLRRAFVNYFK